MTEQAGLEQGAADAQHLDPPCAATIAEPVGVEEEVATVHQLAVDKEFALVTDQQHADGNAPATIADQLGGGEASAMDQQLGTEEGVAMPQQRRRLYCRGQTAQGSTGNIEEEIRPFLH